MRKYFISYTGNPAGSADVEGGNTTYRELGGLIFGQTYALRVLARDFSGNESPPTGEFKCTVQQLPDTTLPGFSLLQPTTGAVYATSANQLTFTGNAQDAGNNLSRAQIRNDTAGVEKWDYSLTGGSADFHAQDMPLAIGDNTVRVAVYDAANNKTEQVVHVNRIGDIKGAVIIIAGHNQDFGLQTNIYNLANRAYRIFKGAGFSDEQIYYLAPVAQDADNDQLADDVDAPTTPDKIQYAITEWAKAGGRVGPGKPLFVYLVDHGLEERYCANGCGPGGLLWSHNLDGWLRTLEEPEVGLDQLTVVIEACRSGSFIDREPLTGVDSPPDPVASSLSREGRVIISSTSRNNNAYASPEGALFSDAFFSCLADSNNLKVCYEQGKAAVQTTGISQMPWMDDNGDALADANDGNVAKDRYVTKFFSSIRPQITVTSLDQQGVNGTLAATVQAGAEEISLVWATVFPPSFQEPAGVTLNLNVPTVRLEPDPAQPGRYVFSYLNGFTEPGAYRVVFYAQDRLGIQAVPKLPGESLNIYLPLIQR